MKDDGIRSADSGCATAETLADAETVGLALQDEILP